MQLLVPRKRTKLLNQIELISDRARLLSQIHIKLHKRARGAVNAAHVAQSVQQ